MMRMTVDCLMTVILLLYKYLFGMTKFAFIDLTEPIVLFFLDYLAIMGLFVFISHYTSEGIRKFPKKQTKE